MRKNKEREAMLTPERMDNALAKIVTKKHKALVMIPYKIQEKSPV